MKEISLTRSELEALVAAVAREVAAGKGISEAGAAAGLMPAMAASGEDSADLARLARLFRHAQLAPQATRQDIERACQEALQPGCAALVVQPAWITLAASRLRGTSVKAATVVGFPFGAGLGSAKRAEAEAAIRAGAREIGLVINAGAVRSGDCAAAELDIRGVMEICRASGVPGGVILESALLTDEQKATACRMAKEAGARFVKTSTGFGPAGASETDVVLMHDAAGPDMCVIAAGGVQTLAESLRMLRAGASRVETSATVSILAEAAGRMN